MVVAIPVVSPTAGTGTTLARYVSLLGDELGTYVEYVIGSTVGAGEAARLVLADELRDDERDAEDWGAELWVYARDGAQAPAGVGAQRRVVRGGYRGPIAGLVLSRPWAAALAPGTTVAITEPLPVRRSRQTKGLVTLVNEALARIWIETLVSITGNAAYEYDLAAYPWLAFGAIQTSGIYDALGLGTDLPSMLSPFDYEIRADGAGRTLVTRQVYGTADTFQLKALVRADVLVSDGTSWSYTATPGLGADTDQAAAPPRWVVAVGMVKALQYLTRRTLTDHALSDAEKQARLSEIAGRRRTWALTAATIVRDEFPKITTRPNAALVGFSSDANSVVERVSAWP